MKLSLKKSLLLAAVLVITNGALAEVYTVKKTITTPQENSTEIYQDIVKYIAMEKKHTDECLTRMGDQGKAKMSLIKKQHDECANLHTEKMKELSRNGCSEEIFENFLMKSIAMKKNHIIQWRDFDKKHYDQCLEMLNRHESELNKFENSVQ